MNRESLFCGVPRSILLLGLLISLTLPLACGGASEGDAGLLEEAPPSMDAPRPESYDGMDANVAQLIQNAISVVEADSDSFQARAGLGMIYQANEMFSLARTAYRQALTQVPDDARLLYHLARVEEKAVGAAVAIERMGRSIELEAGYGPSYWRRGGWLIRENRLPEAEADFRTAMELNPGDPAGPLGLARVLIDLERPEEALPLLEAQIEVDANDPLSHLLLGNALRSLGRLDEAEPHLRAGQGEQVVRDDPWTASDIYRFRISFSAQMQTAVTLLGMGQMPQAIEIFERLRSKDGQDARLLRQLGGAYVAAGRVEEGVATLDEGVSLHPNDPNMLNEAAEAHFVTGSAEKSLGLIERTLEIEPENPLALARRGVILQKLNRLSEAAHALRAALTQSPEDVRLMRRLGDVFMQLREYEYASAAYQNILRITGDEAETQARLGFALYRLNRYAGAEVVLNKAIAGAGATASQRWIDLRDEVKRLNDIANAE
jgi:tetratricopeptide (TPR) repeat protein